MGTYIEAMAREEQTQMVAMGLALILVSWLVRTVRRSWRRGCVALADWLECLPRHDRSQQFGWEHGLSPSSTSAVSITCEIPDLSTWQVRLNY